MDAHFTCKELEDLKFLAQATLQAHIVTVSYISQTKLRSYLNEPEIKI
jgi:hypothetical protein